MPDPHVTSHGPQRSALAVASYQRLAAKIEPAAAALITIDSWTYVQDDDHTTAHVTRAVLAAHRTETERRASALQATADRMRAERAQRTDRTFVTANLEGAL